MIDELLNKYDTIRKVNRLIAEETKSINENSPPSEMYHTIRMLRTEVGEAIKDFPTQKMFERHTLIDTDGKCMICGADLKSIRENISYCFKCGRRIDKREEI